jgi:hypothetical protein
MEAFGFKVRGKMHNFALIMQSGFQKTQDLTLNSKQTKKPKKSLYKKRYHQESEGNFQHYCVSIFIFSKRVKINALLCQITIALILLLKEKENCMTHLSMTIA